MLSQQGGELIENYDGKTRSEKTTVILRVGTGKKMTTEEQERTRMLDTFLGQMKGNGAMKWVD